MSYYKKTEDGEIQKANQVHTPTLTLDDTTKDQEAEGWKWFDVPEDAFAYHSQDRDSISAWQAQAALKLTPYGDGGVTLCCSRGTGCNRRSGN